MRPLILAHGPRLKLSGPLSTSRFVVNSKKDLGGHEVGAWYKHALNAAANISSMPGIADAMLYVPSDGPMWDGIITIEDSTPQVVIATAGGLG